MRNGPGGRLQEQVAGGRSEIACFAYGTWELAPHLLRLDLCDHCKCDRLCPVAVHRRKYVLVYACRQRVRLMVLLVGVSLTARRRRTNPILGNR